ELGAGTDPKEGAALGEAIVRQLTDTGARLVVTTHHSALKTLSQHDPRIENASLVFDVATLSPSYEFRVGLPGASYAIDIARRLGLPEDVIGRATVLLGEQEKDLTHLLNELDERLEAVKRNQSDLEQHRQAATDLEQLYRARLEKFEKSETERKSEALAEAERIVVDTRREMERLVREIRENQAERERVRSAHKDIARRLEDISTQREDLKPPPPLTPKTAPGPIAIGDRVWIDAFQRDGDVVDCDEERGKVKVRIGDFLYTLDRAAVAKAEPGQVSPPPRPRPTIHIEADTEVGPELALRGYSVEEALDHLDRYLDDARIQGWTEVRIVHGKGEGILRRAVGEFLARDERVSSRRLGHWNEGADGVTIATLRPLS
ncbi:MAG TPA: Smr/MutS family protein, partial [Acidobacteriota bacterium]|nr:Smr/MutS family protein [Acidobacteriota bacterium]